MRIVVSLIALWGLVFTAACQANPADAGESFEVSLSPDITSGLTPLPDSSDQEIATPDRIDETMTKLPERVPPTQATSPVTGEVPTDLLDPIVKDLARQTGAAPEKISVIQAQAIVWNDGSLGCPRPGISYTQARVNGYWVILEVGNQKYDYRVADTGYFFLCERGVSPGTFLATPNS